MLTIKSTIFPRAPAFARGTAAFALIALAGTGIALVDPAPVIEQGFNTALSTAPKAPQSAFGTPEAGSEAYWLGQGLGVVSDSQKSSRLIGRPRSARANESWSARAPEPVSSRWSRSRRWRPKRRRRISPASTSGSPGREFRLSAATLRRRTGPSFASRSRPKERPRRQRHTRSDPALLRYRNPATPSGARGPPRRLLPSPMLPDPSVPVIC